MKGRISIAVVIADVWLTSVFFERRGTARDCLLLKVKVWFQHSSRMRTVRSSLYKGSLSRGTSLTYTSLDIYPLERDPPDRDSLLGRNTPPPPEEHGTISQTGRWHHIETPTPSPINRQKGVKTVPCPKLRLREEIILWQADAKQSRGLLESCASKLLRQYRNIEDNSHNQQVQQTSRQITLEVQIQLCKRVIASFFRGGRIQKQDLWIVDGKKYVLTTNFSPCSWARCFDVNNSI